MGVLFGTLGLFYSMAVIAFAVAISGGGHGFNSSVFSIFSFMLIPVFGFAISLPKSIQKQVTILIIFSLTLFLDLLTIGSGFHEMDYLTKVFSRAPISLIIWSILWFGWQIPLFVIVYYSFLQQYLRKRKEEEKGRS